MLSQDERTLIRIFGALRLPLNRAAEALLMASQRLEDENGFDPEPGPPGQPMPALRLWTAA